MPSHPKLFGINRLFESKFNLMLKSVPGNSDEAKLFLKFHGVKFWLFLNALLSSFGSVLYHFNEYVRRFQK